MTEIENKIDADFEPSDRRKQIENTIRLAMQPLADWIKFCKQNVA